MSLMGVNTINALRECTRAMPRGDKAGPPGPEPSSESTSYTTSTAYSTVATVTSCPPDKANCPYGSHTTDLVPVSTTHHDAHAQHHTNTTGQSSPAPTAKTAPITAGAGRMSAGLFAAAAGFLAALW